MAPVIIWLSALVILTIIHIFRSPGKRSFKDILGAFLLYLTVINVGLYSLWHFFANIFYPDEIAKYIGWGSGSQFQYEVAIAYLAFGIMGILCYWEKGDFWLATVIGFSIFLFGSGLGHLRDYIQSHNAAEGNIGPILYIDLILPIVLLVLTMIHRRLE